MKYIVQRINYGKHWLNFVTKILFIKIMSTIIVLNFKAKFNLSFDFKWRASKNV